MVPYFSVLAIALSPFAWIFLQLGADANSTAVSYERIGVVTLLTVAVMTLFRFYVKQSEKLLESEKHMREQDQTHSTEIRALVDDHNKAIRMLIEEHHRVTQDRIEKSGALEVKHIAALDQLKETLSILPCVGRTRVKPKTKMKR